MGLGTPTLSFSCERCGDFEIKCCCDLVCLVRRMDAIAQILNRVLQLSGQGGTCSWHLYVIAFDDATKVEAEFTLRELDLL